MKIEKVNENQIRCILSKEDLDARQLKLSELAYGSDKAKRLFQDMMEIASEQLNFEAEDIPLMIEAVPMSAGSILLIVTKSELPEELDPRFANFSETIDDYDEETEVYESEPEVKQSSVSANDIISLFEKAKQSLEGVKEEERKNAEIPVDLTKLYVFNSFDDLLALSKVLKDYYKGVNTLYKLGNTYNLIVSKTDHTPEEFNKVCNMIAEYANQDNLTPATEQYFMEHYTPIVVENALQVLADL